jgi:hypothetical protein
MTINLVHYRSSLEYREILRILQRASSQRENIIWQSHAMGKNVIPIHHFEIDFVGREVVVYFDTQLYKIDYGIPLFIKLDYRTSVFKVMTFRAGPSCVHFAFPKEIKTLEMRHHPRFLFKENSENVVYISPSRGGKECANGLQVRAVDISRDGLGLIISEPNRPFLKNNRFLWISKIQDTALSHPVLAEVVYIKSDIDSKGQRRKRSRDLKVGLKLSEVLPEEFLEQFKS